MRTAKCMGCGDEIIWAVTDNEKIMPLDAKPLTMFTIDTKDGKCRCSTTRVFQTHWATCKNAEEFRK